MSPDEAAIALSPKSPPAREFIGTGSMALDIALGGYPVGRVTEITGDPKSGKTTLALMAVREMQKHGTVAYVDLAGEFSPVYAMASGIDVDELLVLHTVPANFGPIRFAVIDGVTSRSVLPHMSQGDRRGPLTAVATSWRYRMNTEVYPWINLKHARSGLTVATAVDGTSPRDRTADLFFGPGGLDRGLELLTLGVEAGLLSRTTSQWYVAACAAPEWYGAGHSKVFIGNGAKKAGETLVGTPMAQWLRSQVFRVLTERQAGK
jgi:hypothetical protein